MNYAVTLGFKHSSLKKEKEKKREQSAFVRRLIGLRKTSLPRFTRLRRFSRTRYERRRRHFPLPVIEQLQKDFHRESQGNLVNPDLLHKQRDHLSVNQTGGFLIKVFNQS